MALKFDVGNDTNKTLNLKYNGAITTCLAKQCSVDEIP